MNIEAGKRYVMANGEITGELVGDIEGGFYTREHVEYGFSPMWDKWGKADFFLKRSDPMNNDYHLVREYEE